MPMGMSEYAINIIDALPKELRWTGLLLRLKQNSFNIELDVLEDEVL
jgi:hypothetical protein